MKRFLSFRGAMVTETTVELIRSKLQQRFNAQKKLNPRYSVRSLARSLGTSPATVSEFLSGKRKLSESLLKKIASNFESFSLTNTEGQGIHSLGTEQSELVSNWLYFSVLSLMETEDFQSDSDWMAQKLGVTTPEINEVLAYLLKRKFCTLKEGRYVPIDAELITSDDLQNTALIRRHISNLERARKSLRDDILSERDFSFMTLAIAKEDLKKYKKLVRKFQDEVVELQSKGRKTDVYEFVFQMFPVTK